MAFCNTPGIDYVLGLPTNAVLRAYAARQRRVVARIETSTLRMDIRYVVTSLAEGSAEQIYDTLYWHVARPRT
jgi:hypothetical protein